MDYVLGANETSVRSCQEGKGFLGKTGDERHLSCQRKDQIRWLITVSKRGRKETRAQRRAISLLAFTSVNPWRAWQNITRKRGKEKRAAFSFSRAKKRGRVGEGFCYLTSEYMKRRVLLFARETGRGKKKRKSLRLLLGKDRMRGGGPALGAGSQKKKGAQAFATREEGDLFRTLVGPRELVRRRNWDKKDVDIATRTEGRSWREFGKQSSQQFS